MCSLETFEFLFESILKYDKVEIMQPANRQLNDTGTVTKEFFCFHPSTVRLMNFNKLDCFSFNSVCVRIKNLRCTGFTK